MALESRNFPMGGEEQLLSLCQADRSKTLIFSPAALNSDQYSFVGLYNTNSISSLMLKQSFVLAAPLFWKGGFPADKTSQTAKLMQPARKLNQWYFWYEPCTDYYVQTCEQTWLDSYHLMKAARHSL
jgi:hypothetical protein